jgi:hypothetical protein
MRRFLAAVILLIVTVNASAQGLKSFGVAYYDVDKLYDTQPSEFYNDSDYSPAGRMRWSEERYSAKINHIVQVVDSMAMPVVVLYGVENEQVVRDIVSRSSEDYAYLHSQSSARDGLDFAVLYFGDRFFPEQITPWRGALCIEGWAGDVPLTIIANHRSTSIGVLIEERNLLRPDNNIILLGQPNKLNFSEYGLSDATLVAENAGRGNYLHSGRWQMRDRIATNIKTECRCDVYIKSWLLGENGAPKPTFFGRKYYGGYSNYLPIFIYFYEIL